MIRAREIAFNSIRKSLDKSPSGTTWLILYKLAYVNIGAPVDLNPTSLAQHQYGIIEQDTIGSLNFIQGRISTRLSSFRNNRDTIHTITSFWRAASITWRARNKDKHGNEQAKLSEQKELLDSQIRTQQRNLGRLSLQLSIPPLGTHRQLSSKKMWIRLVTGGLRHSAAAQNNFQQSLSGVNTSNQEHNEPVLTQHGDAKKQTTTDPTW
jgi:hypothetical protein